MTRVHAHFKLPEDQMRRLEKLSKRRGQTKQAFIEGAVFAEMTAEEQRRGKLQPHETLPAPSIVQPAFGMNDDEAPREAGGGFDLAWLKTAPTRKFPELDAPIQQQAPVVVNVGNSEGSNRLDFLVNFVLSGKNEFEQQNKMRTVASILQDTVPNEEERRTLAAKVDELVAAKKKTTPQNEDAGVFRTAKLVYDKLQDLLK